MTIPDPFFWYSVSSVLIVILIWIVQRHIVKTDKLLERLTDTINTLSTNVAVLEERITALEDLIDKHIK